MEVIECGVTKNAESSAIGVKNAEDFWIEIRIPMYLVYDHI